MEISNYKFELGLETPVRAIVVADLHSENYLPILSKIEELSPDVILSVGDVIHKASVHERGLDFLRAAALRYPLFTCLGNHEVKGGVDIRDVIRKTGAVLLDNEFTRFRGILFGGLSTGYTYLDTQSRHKEPPPPNLYPLENFFASKEAKILLSHHPEYFDKYLRPRDSGIVISGHAHGGQWRFFGRGIFAPGQGIFPKYTSGLYHDRLLVSRGLSNKTPIPRIFNKRHLIVINLI